MGKNIAEIKLKTPDKEIKKSEIEEEFQKEVTKTVSIKSSSGFFDCVEDDKQIDKSILESIDSFDIRELCKLVLNQTIADRKTIKNIIRKLIQVAESSDNPGLWFPLVNALNGVPIPTKNLVKMIEVLAKKNEEQPEGNAFCAEEIVSIIEGVKKEKLEKKDEEEEGKS